MGGGYWWIQSHSRLPAGITSANGRLEADELDVATKFSGRVVERMADEGDLVRAGQVIARMDTKDLEATLSKGKAQLLAAQKSVVAAQADLEKQRTEVNLARQQLERTNSLMEKGFATGELLDQRRQIFNFASAALSGAEARVGEAEATVEAARHDLHLTEINIADASLTAPRDGRIQYRLADAGEVLAAGGKVFTLLDLNYVYMDVFMPTADAGSTSLGADARILMDAMPGRPVPAKVVFVSDEAQFTPKMVETKAERDKLMFRVRVRVDPAFLKEHSADLRAGQPGVAYVRLDPATPWPAFLEPGATDAAQR